MKSTHIQTLIFDKSKYRNKSQVREWCNRNNFKIMNNKKGIDEKKNTYRVRQRQPSRFNKNTFRTIDFSKNIKAVIGLLK